MTPNQKQHIQTLMANGRQEQARDLLDRLIKEKNDKDAILMRGELETLYPETRVMKGAKAANKIVFYVSLAITLFLVAAVIFGVIWVKVINR